MHRAQKSACQLRRFILELEGAGGGTKTVPGAKDSLRKDTLDVEIEGNIEQDRDAQQSKGDDRDKVHLTAHGLQVLK